MKFEELDEFKKDFKRLLKKYKTLNDDFEIIKKVLEAAPEERPPVSYRISGLGIHTNVMKMKRIACKAMKGRGSNTGLRLIYAYEKSLERITMIEFYHKNEKEKENEDKERVRKYFA
jgi:mRNA-degrading endonuclease RelE of RelBE toxin-antitoxin system